jgi:S-adenosylmethionine synthetase
MVKVTFFSTSMPLKSDHPDADPDMISDNIEREVHSLDSDAEIKCATHVEDGVAMIACEVAADASIDTSKVVRKTIHQLFESSAG